MEVSTNNIPVLVALVALMGISLLIGLLPSKKASKGFLSFMIADKALPWWAIAGSCFATYAGTTCFLGWIGNSGKIGISAAWQFALHATSFLMLGLFFVPILVRMKRVTLAEPLGERFGSDLRRISSFFSFARLIGSTASQIVGIGVLISMFSTLDLRAACILSAIVLILYVSIGGMYGVAYADTMQGLIMLLFIVVAPIVLLAIIGNGSMAAGFSQVIASLPEKNLNMSTAGTNKIIGWVLVMSVANLLRPELYGRIFSARSPKEGVRTWVVVTSMVIVMMIVTLILGMICTYAVPNFEGTNDQYGPAMFIAIAPQWLTILYVLGIMGAAVSTASSAMLGCSSHYITDFHLPIFYKNAQPSQKTMVVLSRIAVIVFTLIALWWALAWKDIITIFQFGYTVLVAGILMPYIGMFFWPRMTSAAAKWSAILGGGTALLWQFVLKPSGILPSGTFIAGLDASVPALILSVSSAIIITYMTAPEYDKVLKFAETYKLTKMIRWAQDGLAEKKSAQ